MPAAVLGLGARRVFAGPVFPTDNPEPVDDQRWDVCVCSTYNRSHGGTGVQAPAHELFDGALRSTIL